MKDKKCKLCRLLRYRLIVPTLRGRNAPKVTARGVMIGLVVAFTPTVGAQMAICAGVWLLLKAIAPNWKFNLIVACAWTWVTNVFTVPPIYYGFLVTGRLLLGHDGWLYGYNDFLGELDQILATDTSGLESLWVYVINIIDLWGLPMLVGSIPWAIALGWVGYVWSLRFLVKFRASQRHHLIEHHEAVR